MKNTKILTVLLSTAVVLTGCSTGSSTTTANNTTTQQTTVKQDEKKVYGLGEEWVVDGQWKLKINSVTATEKRNSFSEEKPEQVVIIDYTYENIGYESNNDIVSGLFLNVANVVDGAGKMASMYPVDAKGPQETPKGATMENAQDAYGLKTVSDEITVTFEQFDKNNKKYSAQFKVPVTK